jgi:hypothetical protein
LCFANDAEAQLATLREHARQMDSGKLALGAELTTFFGNVDATGYSLVQPSPFVALRFREAVLEALAPFAYLHESNDPGSDHNLLTAGNPWFGLSYLPDTSCGLARLSLGVAPELASGGTPRRRQLLALARGAQGAQDGYLFVNRLLPLVFGGGALKDLARLRLSWDADAIIGLPGGGRDTEFGVQGAGEVGVRFGWQTLIALRASAAYYPTLDGDAFQSAVALRVRHARVRGDSFGVRFAMNLDGPAGFSFAHNGVWGLALSYAASP